MGLHNNEVYEQTISLPTTTAVMIDGEICPVWELERRHGITLEEWRMQQAAGTTALQGAQIPTE